MIRLSLIALLCVPVSAWAGGTTLVQQGRLLDAGGIPLEGQQDVIFTVYDGGSVAWAETDTITFAGGYYATVLGDNNPTLHDLDFANGTYTLGITVGTTPELSPRTPLTSVVSALRGPINISDDGAETVCNSAATGTLRYRGQVQVCDGSSWATVGTGASSGTCSSGQQVFQTTGSSQTFTVPAGCSTLVVEAWGAGGASGYNSHDGGAGGYTKATVGTSAGTAYTVVVGQGGIRNTQSGNGGAQAAYGFAGAPYGNASACAVGGGGGLSGLFLGPVNPSNAILVAGGGGGSSGYTSGGSGNDAVNGGGQVSLSALPGDSAWEGGGGGGYSGGSLHVRSSSNSSYQAGEGGTGFAGGTGVLAGTVVLEASAFSSRVPPAVVSVNYSGTGTSGDAAFGYGGIGGVYGVNCDSSGDGLVVISYSQ
jgi:hypothetical protein